MESAVPSVRSALGEERYWKPGMLEIRAITELMPLMYKEHQHVLVRVVIESVEHITDGNRFPAAAREADF